MYIDLHCHTHYSDGKHSVNQLLSKALNRGIRYLSITDHDTTMAIAPFASALKKKIQIYNSLQVVSSLVAGKHTSFILLV